MCVDEGMKSPRRGIGGIPLTGSFRTDMTPRVRFISLLGWGEDRKVTEVGSVDRKEQVGSEVGR